MPIDKDRLVQLLLREHNTLAAYSWSLVRDEHLVDDIMQELALVMVRRGGEIVDEHHFPKWARSVCRLTALDMLKRRRRRPHPLGDGVLDLIDAQWAQGVDRNSADLTEALRICLQKLSPYARQLIELRYAEGLKSADIASRLGRTVIGVYEALSRAHRRLGECIRGRLAKESPNG